MNPTDPAAYSWPPETADLLAEPPEADPTTGERGPSCTHVYPDGTRCTLSRAVHEIPGLEHRTLAAEPDAGEVQTLTDDERDAVNVAIDEAETCECCGDDYGSKHVHSAVERIVAARIAADRAATAERIAQAIEAEASRSSYRDPYAATEAYLNAAVIARGEGR